LVHIWFWD